jgi:type III HopJ-like effector protein
MSLQSFLDRISSNEAVSFDDTMTAINEHYDYTPTEFSNGIGAKAIINAAKTNEGSCKIFAFAMMNELNQEQTLNLFGDYYRTDVLQDPTGNSHQNIRNFMQFGWDGIRFSNSALTEK